MFVVLWEFEVKPGCEERFETVYGPSGDWARLFGRDPSYRETLLLRDPFRTRTYLTLDFWDSREAYEAFREANLSAYTTLDRACEALTSAERKIGSYGRLPENE
jgi:heme-degrading monooxygenase HmoA